MLIFERVNFDMDNDLQAYSQQSALPCRLKDDDEANDGDKAEVSLQGISDQLEGTHQL